MCPSDAKFWMTDLAPEGKAKEWCLADRKEGYASFLNNEVSFYRENDNFYSLTKSPPLMLQEKKKWQDNLMKGGLAAPLCWYKVTMQNLSSSDEASKSTVCAHLTLKRLMTIRIRHPLGEIYCTQSDILRCRSAWLYLPGRCGQALNTAILSESNRGWLRHQPLGDACGAWQSKPGVVEVDRIAGLCEREAKLSLMLKSWGFLLCLI